MAGRPRIVIRSDAGAEIGTGHLRRCLVLADALEQAGATPVLAVRAETRALLPQLRTRHAVIELGPDDEHARLASEAAGSHAVVVDHYGLGAGWETAARSWARHVIVIDDAPGRQHDCDLLIDQTPFREAGEYADTTGPRALRLCGAPYVLLRDEFRAAAARRRSTLHRPPQLLVTFGGSDPAGLTLLAIDALRLLTASAPRTTIVVGPANRHADQIAQRAAGADRLEIVAAPQSMAEFMQVASLALTGSGTTCWELAHVGVPMLVVSNSMGNVAAAVARAGAGLDLGAGGSLEAAALAAAIQSTASNDRRLRQMSDSGRALIDGRGSERVASAVLALVGTTA